MAFFVVKNNDNKGSMFKKKKTTGSDIHSNKIVCFSRRNRPRQLRDDDLDFFNDGLDCVNVRIVDHR